MLVMMKKICRAACPNRGWRVSASNVAAMKTENSRTLPTIPTGQAQMRRRSPPMRRGEAEGVAEDLAPQNRVGADGDV